MTADTAPRPARSHPDSTGGDPGWFGPDSVTWRVMGDPVTSVGGLRALVMQALHPETMAIFDAHTDVRADFWGRLERTAEYVAVVTYGSAPEAERMTARIRGIHRSVPPAAATGPQRRAGDPDLLLWVHATLVDSFLTVARRGGVRLTAAEADGFVEEQSLLARHIGITGPGAPPVPVSVAELADYIRDIRPDLRATPAARSAVRLLLVPPMPVRARVAGPAWSTLAGLGIATLPRWARRMYGLPGLPTTDLATTVTLRALRTTLLAVPAGLREGPHRAAARARLGVPA